MIPCGRLSIFFRSNFHAYLSETYMEIPKLKSNLINYELFHIQIIITIFVHSQIWANFFFFLMIYILVTVWESWKLKIFSENMWCTPTKQGTSDILCKIIFWYHCMEHTFSFILIPKLSSYSCFEIWSLVVKTIRGFSGSVIFAKLAFKSVLFL